MNNDKEQNNSKIKQEKRQCYCCKKIKEGKTIQCCYKSDKDCEHRFICIDCNTLN